MAEEKYDYARFFHAEQRVGTDIPIAGGRFFREWGIIETLKDDFAEISLSRDMLPKEVELDYGVIVQLVTGKEGTGYACRAIVVGKLTGKIIPIRLIGEVVLHDRRNYYRLAAIVPMAYSIPESQAILEIKSKWQEKRRLRAWQWSEEHEGMPFLDPLPPEQRIKLKDFAESCAAEQLDTMAANISGGGIRIKTAVKVYPGNFLNLQIYFPFAKPNIIDIVGEVIWTSPITLSSSRQTLYNSAMRFLYLDERDRESIIRFISMEQLQRLKQLREHDEAANESMHELNVAEPLPVVEKDQRIALTICGFLLLVVILFWVVPNFITYYQQHHSKNEIQRVFEKGIIKYKQQKED